MSVRLYKYSWTEPELTNYTCKKNEYYTNIK